MSSPNQQEFIELVSQSVSIRYCYFAACVVYGYDYVLTFSQEIDHVWRRRFTLPTAAFLLLRYITPFELVLSVGIFYPSVISAFSCHMLKAVGALNVIAVVLIGCILAFRTVALYNYNKFILWLLSSLVLAQSIMLAVIAGGTVKIIYNQKLGACITESPTELYITALWWCPLVIDTVVFLLTVIRLRALRKVMHLNYSLFHVIMRDGVFYYIIICLVYVSNTVNWMVNPGISHVAGLNCGLAIPAVMICRLTLNLQGVRSSPDNPTYSTTDDTISGVLTSSPSVLSRTAWLVGERWDGIIDFEHPDDFAGAKEREIPLTVLQTAEISSLPVA